MDPIRLVPEREPEFEPPLSERLRTVHVAPGAYHRMVANPFLGFLGLLAWLSALYYLAIRRAAEEYSLFLAVVVIVNGVWLPRLFHYHCRDCGTTGPLRRWREHVCYRVATRQLAGRPRRFHGPSPVFQVIIWTYALVLLFAAIKSLRR